MSFSCRDGICHVCVLRCVSGPIPEHAQRSLKPDAARLGCFLPCRCRPSGDMVVVFPDEELPFLSAEVIGKEPVAPDICRLLLRPTQPLNYRPGQYVNLRKADGLTRSYSLASLPGDDPPLELHVQRVPDGVMTHRIFEQLTPGDVIEILGARGDCVYHPGEPDAPMLLIGTGSVLAPLMGIVREALESGHLGPVHLYHGARHADGLHLRERLNDLAARHPDFHYTPCVSADQPGRSERQGLAHELALAEHPRLEGWRVYLCGSPAMAHHAGEAARAAGAENAHIRADAFDSTVGSRRAPPGSAGSDDPELNEEVHVRPLPDPPLWAALGHGMLLSDILGDFYGRVFEDPRPAPYFEGVTKEHVAGKQYSFLYELFTGEDVYFGQWPRNAHYWMVISDELFDYREGLLVSCMRRHGLAEHLIERWRRLEEGFRRQIVKARPWKKIAKGVEYPVEGYGDEILNNGAICDGCARILEPGEHLRYHLRLGSLYCDRYAARGQLHAGTAIAP